MLKLLFLPCCLRCVVLPDPIDSEYWGLCCWYCLHGCYETVACEWVTGYIQPAIHFLQKGIASPFGDRFLIFVSLYVPGMHFAFVSCVQKTYCFALY